jgi:subtilisin family serine protease
MTYTNDTERIIASVSPRSVGGVSLFESTEAITAENVNQYYSEAADIAAASNELRQRGFEVLEEGQVTISIAGPRQLFEEVFGARFSTQRTALMVDQEVEFMTSETLLQAPDELANLIEGIAIARPPEYYESALPPLAKPEAGAYRYLLVPDEVGLILNADRVHRLGASGKGVKVAMIDTGFYRHPFYNWHGYSVNATILGPGAANPDKDEVGHGTGEAANIFANAPGITLIPIKDADDPVGCFSKAIAAGANVITNSWGYDIDSMTWAQLKAIDPGFYAYMKSLEAVVANAVASGIVVCFAAGNGQRGFPGSHPDVISVGGVHPNYPFLSYEDLEASSYSSSFSSKLYPGRRVPDLCGLVGKRTAAGTAPLIMLPVQPGCYLDLPNTGANNDGWGIFSGTSAACPQVAGVAALLIEKKPSMTPAEVKEKLVKSATDVKKGSSAMGNTAGPGVDAATGAGLVNAKWAWLQVTADVAAEFFSASAEQQAAMLDSGQMPRNVKHYVEDLINVLRSR